MTLRRIHLLATFLAIVFILGLGSARNALADTFGTGANAFEIAFVTIGDPGNPPDPEISAQPPLAGSVDYVYRMGTYEISEQMINKANAATAGTDDPLNITIDVRGPDRPATRANWFEAARFVNWLNTSSGYSPAYKFLRDPRFPNLREFALWEPTDPGYDPDNLFRNALAHYFLPSADEWYKAAYFDPDSGEYFSYPNGSLAPPHPVASGTAPNTAVFGQSQAPAPTADTTETGGPSPYGTVGQGGSVNEWMETTFDLRNDSASVFIRRIHRGGRWNQSDGSMQRNIIVDGVPDASLSNVGFRVASVPEPNTGILIVVFTLCLLRRGTGYRRTC